MIAAERRPWVVDSLKLVAEFFGVAYGTARAWSMDGMPGSPKDGWDLAAALAWRESRPGAQRAAASAGTGDLDEQLKTEQIRKHRLANDLKEGRLLDRHGVEQSAAELCLRVKTRLEAFPDEFEMRFPAETRIENKADLDHAVVQLLREMAAFRIGAET